MMNQQLKNVLLIGLGAALLLAMAFVNGYPIVYSDTSTYLASGFELETPFDRPIFYGLFVRFASLNGLSLWLVIAAQAMLISFLVYKLLQLTLFERFTSFIFLASMGSLSLLTSVSWVVSQLMPDIFTAMLVLSLGILLSQTLSVKEQLGFYSIFLLASLMHLSHITFNIIFILLLLILRKIKWLDWAKVIPLKPLLICLVLTIISLSTMGSALSKSKHGFLMGALVEHGITKTYLDEYCDQKPYKFCAYKDSLPDEAWKFLWNEDSPFYKLGGWQGTKKEFNEIIFNTFTNPKYILLHIRESIKATGYQLVKFKIGDGNGIYSEGTLLYKRIALYVPREAPSYLKSLQNTDKLGFVDTYNLVLMGIMALVALGFVVSLFQWKHLDKPTQVVVWVVLLGILLNAWSSGTFANAIDRLGCKVSWLLPLITLMLYLKLKGRK